MLEAAEEFNKGNVDKAIELYSHLILEPDSQLKLPAILNRASAFFSVQQYPKVVEDCQAYLELAKQPPPEIFVLYLSSLMKLEKFEEAGKVSKEALELFPHHKKIKDLSKTNKEKMIANDQELFVEAMFEKLCMHPRIREYLKDESFLTKVERMIRNPSLTSTLAKMDPRIEEANEVLLMAEEEA